VSFTLIVANKPIMLNLIMPNVVMLSVFMLSIVMLNVLATFKVPNNVDISLGNYFLIIASFQKLPN
jgi:hypothetical protein